MEWGVGRGRETKRFRLLVSSRNALSSQVWVRLNQDPAQFRLATWVSESQGLDLPSAVSLDMSTGRLGWKQNSWN